MAEPAQEVELEPGGIEVDIAQETPPAGKQAAVPIEPPAQAVTPPVAAPAVGVETLQGQIKALEAREAAALRERANQERIARDRSAELQRAQEEIARSRGETIDARRATIDTSIIAAQGEADSARRDYQLALEAGDFAKASEANYKLNKAAAQVVLLEEKKTVFAENANAPRVTEGAVTRQAQQRPSSDVDSYIETKSPRTQAWLREHPDAVTDPRLNNKTVAAHYEALAEGYSPDTDSYFGFIDRKLGFAGNVEPEQAFEAPPVETAPARKAPTQKTPPAAPVSRDPPRSERTATRMYLTRGEQEVAEALGITPSEYARRKQSMEKQGFYHG